MDIIKLPKTIVSVVTLPIIRQSARRASESRTSTTSTAQNSINHIRGKAHTIPLSLSVYIRLSRSFTPPPSHPCLYINPSPRVLIGIIAPPKAKQAKRTPLPCPEIRAFYKTPSSIKKTRPAMLRFPRDELSRAGKQSKKNKSKKKVWLMMVMVSPRQDGIIRGDALYAMSFE